MRNLKRHCLGLIYKTNVKNRMMFLGKGVGSELKKKSFTEVLASSQS